MCMLDGATLPYVRSARWMEVSAVKAPAASAKFALQGDFMKGHGSLSMSKSAVVAERTALRISCGESRIGKQSVPLPKGVTYEIKGQTLTVKVRTLALHPKCASLLSLFSLFAA
eukprot:557790-Prorocentrum_minimum.AAC.4